MSHQRRLRFLVSSTNHQPQSERRAGADAGEARRDHQAAGGAADLPQHAIEIVFGARDPLQRALVRHEPAVRIGAGEAFADRFQDVGVRLAPGIDRRGEAIQRFAKILGAGQHGRRLVRMLPRFGAQAFRRRGRDEVLLARPLDQRLVGIEPLHRRGRRPAAQRVDERQHAIRVDGLGRHGRRTRGFGHSPDCRPNACNHQKLFDSYSTRGIVCNRH